MWANGMNSWSNGKLVDQDAIVVCGHFHTSWGHTYLHNYGMEFNEQNINDPEQHFEPFIDTHTMGVHYHKHEQTYLNNLNNLLNKNNFNYNYDIDELIYHINEFPDDDKENILFNLGGVINHELYWKGISQNNYLPNGKLKNKIDSQYGNFDNF